MKTKDFLKQYSACTDGATWALSIGEDMVDVWDAMVEQGKHDWLIWTATRPGVFPDSVLRKLACRFVRETPLHDGRKVWDLLTDKRSRKAVEVAEAHAEGKATYEELEAACAAARAAAYDAAAYNAAARAAYDTARDAAASSAARVAARDAAHAADAASSATHGAACAAAATAYDAATYVAAAAAARDAAKAAQVQMIAEMGNPFRKGQKDERNNEE